MIPKICKINETSMKSSSKGMISVFKGIPLCKDLSYLFL